MMSEHLFSKKIILPRSGTCCLIILLACSAQTRAGDIPTYDAKTFFETTSYTSASFSHNESRILVSSDDSGVFNAFSIPVSGGTPKPLTDSKSDAIFAKAWFPSDDRFIYMADQGGNEKSHVYVRESNGTARDVTPGDQLKGNFLGFHRDDEHFFVTTNERDPKAFDLYQYNTDGYTRKLLYQNNDALGIAAVSRDGRWIALEKKINNADSNILLWDARSPDQPAKLITNHEGQAQHDALTFTPDSKSLYYNTDAHGEFFQAWTYELESGQHSPAVKADWDVLYVNFSRNGRFRVHGVNTDARTEVTIIDTSSGKKVAMPGLPDGDLTGIEFSPSEKLIALYLSSDTAPKNLYVVNIETGDYRKLTESLNPVIKQEHLVEGNVVRFDSFDGRKIPAILWKPKGASANNKAPAMVYVHGGPGGQTRHGYNPIIQHLVNHGYAVFAVNNRGSSGYGKTFFHLDDRNHGEGDLQDCVFGKKYLENLDWVDKDKIGIIGGSYGGYMVAAALTFQPDEFDVGIDIFGVTNWLRTMESIPPWWESFREMLFAEIGDPATDKDRLHRISPLFHADQIKKPLLVVQGANDPRVLQVESDEIVEAVRKNGIPVEYVVFPDEGHGFRKRENRIKASDTYVKFLDKYLKAPKAAKSD
jgi:prolyl oligopeptidase